VDNELILPKQQKNFLFNVIIPFLNAVYGDLMGFLCFFRFTENLLNTCPIQTIERIGSKSTLKRGIKINQALK